MTTECLAPDDPCDCKECQEAMHEYLLNNFDYHSMEADLKEHWDCISITVRFDEKKGQFRAGEFQPGTLVRRCAARSLSMHRDVDQRTVQRTKRRRNIPTR